jgi:hypothetical protein
MAVVVSSVQQFGHDILQILAFKTFPPPRTQKHVPYHYYQNTTGITFGHT